MTHQQSPLTGTWVAKCLTRESGVTGAHVEHIHERVRGSIQSVRTLSCYKLPSQRVSVTLGFACGTAARSA